MQTRAMTQPILHHAAITRETLDPRTFVPYGLEKIACA